MTLKARKARQFIIDSGITSCNFGLSIEADIHKVTLAMMQSALDDAKYCLSLI